MLKFLVLVVAVLAGAYFFPQVYESTSGPCQALEAKIIRAVAEHDAELAATMGMVGALSDGRLARAIVAEEYPDLPDAAGCALGYYRLDLENARI